MIEARAFPFGGVPVYNPQSLTRGEAIAQFHARRAAYDSLLDLLREERPSHVLIIGTRGMGKTTLLQRVHYGVEEDLELNRRYLVLAFPEEQYNVNRLHHFLLNAVDALADAMERLKNARMLDRVEEYVATVRKLSQEEIESRVPKFLAEVGQELGRSLLMLVDNADRLFDTIEDREQWRLRDLLSSRPDLTLFGATTQASEGIYGAERAFFEFFKIHRLTPLTLEEVRALLLRLSESVEEPEDEKGTAKQRVQEWLDADAARLRTLVQLTGGNPRTTVLLFHLVLDGLGGGAREYLEQLLDQCTPGYKGRVDELPPQAQQVLDAVALKWDPVTAMEIGEVTGLETNVVSTQLTRLVRQGVLEKADPGDSKKALYQVAERFFNIWYLMRASRRVRAKLRWFVEFLRVFFESGELERMAWDRLERFRSGTAKRAEEIETAFAYILASGVDRNRFEDYLRRECADSVREWQPLLSLIRVSVREDPLGRVGAEVVNEDGSELSEADARRATEAEPDSSKAWESLGGVLAQRHGRGDEAESAFRKAIELDPRRIPSWILLATLLLKRPGRVDEAVEAIRRAIELKPQAANVRALLDNLLACVSGRWKDAEAAMRRAVDIEPESASVWVGLGSLLARTPKRKEEAEVAFRNAIKLNPRSADSWTSLGEFLEKTTGRVRDAELAFRKAIELEPQSSSPWNGLGRLLAQLERAEESEAAFKRAIEFDPGWADPWIMLGNLVANIPERREEAESFFRKATKVDPKSSSTWLRLGICLIRRLERLDEAESDVRKAIELSPKYFEAWAALGILLRYSSGRSEEAETALRQAIELDPKPPFVWTTLAELLWGMPGRSADASAAFAQALERDPCSGETWGNFGVFLACRASKPAEAESALRKAVELEPENPKNIRNLGVLLYCENLKEQEGVHYIRRAWQISNDSTSAAVLAACIAGNLEVEGLLATFLESSRGSSFWDELLELCQNYAPFGKILLGICDLVLEHDSSNKLALLPRAAALAQLGDFPRASVALEDALVGDPIDLLSSGRNALEIFLSAAVRHGRVQDCLELLDKKEWKDAWRPIYEALRSVQEGTGEYLKRVAVEIREPALIILRRIAPELPGLPSRT
jgi:Flp pilus assembly protein TadD